jgi:hypothetical protein
MFRLLPILLTVPLVLAIEQQGISESSISLFPPELPSLIIEHFFPFFRPSDQSHLKNLDSLESFDRKITTPYTSSSNNNTDQNDEELESNRW